MLECQCAGELGCQGIEHWDARMLRSWDRGLLGDWGAKIMGPEMPGGGIVGCLGTGCGVPAVSGIPGVPEQGVCHGRVSSGAPHKRRVPKRVPRKRGFRVSPHSVDQDSLPLPQGPDPGRRGHREPLMPPLFPVFPVFPVPGGSRREPPAGVGRGGGAQNMVGGSSEVGRF